MPYEWGTEPEEVDWTAFEREVARERETGGLEPYGVATARATGSEKAIKAAQAKEIAKSGADRLAWLKDIGATDREISQERGRIQAELISLYYVGINELGFDVTGGRDVLSWTSSLIWEGLGEKGEDVRQDVQKSLEAGAQPEREWERPEIPLTATGQELWGTYESFISGFESPRMQEWARTQYPAVVGKYPSPRTEVGFKGFLEQYPFLEKYEALPPAKRGEGFRRFAPPTRWLTF